jgi:hypothetical protein
MHPAFAEENLPDIVSCVTNARANQDFIAVLPSVARWIFNPSNFIS